MSSCGGALPGQEGCTVRLSQGGGGQLSHLISCRQPLWHAYVINELSYRIWYRRTIIQLFGESPPVGSATKATWKVPGCCINTQIKQGCKPHGSLSFFQLPSVRFTYPEFVNQQDTPFPCCLSDGPGRAPFILPSAP